jgi:hypothetical protein
MAMTETKRQTEFLISFPTKIVQQKRKVTALLEKPRVARAVKDFCKKDDSSFRWTKAFRGYSAASFSIILWQETSVITLMIGFNTAGEGHKKFVLAVKTERSWEVGMRTS